MKYMTVIMALVLSGVLAVGQALAEGPWPQPGNQPPPSQGNPPPKQDTPPPPRQENPPPPKQDQPPPNQGNQPKQGNPPPKQEAPPPSQNNPPPKQDAPKAPEQDPQRESPSLKEEKPITWQATSLAGAIAAAKSQKKVSYLYFYLKDKEDFPKNYDGTLAGYSENRAVFAKIFVKTDDKGKIVGDDVSAFFAKHKLAKGTNAVLLDPYGNFLNTVSSTAANKITAAIDSADKKVISIEADFKQRSEKAAKLEKELDKDRAKKMPEYIKALLQIAEDKYQGYPAVEKAKDKLKELDKAALGEYKAIVKAYLETEEEEREPETAIGQLDSIVKTYKGLPSEKTAQESIKIIKKGELPSLAEEKPGEKAKKSADGENEASRAEKPSDKPADKK